MAPPGNVDVVTGIIEAMSRRDLDAVLAASDADCELTPLISAWPEPYRGHEGLRRWFDDTAFNWERWEVEVTEARELERDTVLTNVRWRGRPRGSESELDGPAAAIWHLRDGKAVSVTVYPDERRALDAQPGG